MGNVHIFRPRIEDDREPKLIPRAIRFQNISDGYICKNISIIDPVSVECSDPTRAINLSGSEQNLRFSDFFRVVTDIPILLTELHSLRIECARGS